MRKLVYTVVLLSGVALPLSGLAFSSELSHQLHDDKNWMLIESREDGIIVFEKEIDGIAVKAVKVTQALEINPEILAQVIEDIANYDRFLKSAAGSEATLLKAGKNYRIGHQHVKVPVMSDRNYAFKLFRPDSTGTRVDWELIPINILDDFLINKRTGVYIDIGAGSWSSHIRPDGKYDVSYRLVMDPGGWLPGSVSDYFNKVSIVSIFKDTILETERRGAEGKS
jgi:hypothetical protein